MPVADLPLAGVCVLELAQGVSGPFCGKLLAEFGAQVTKVEPPTGDITRHRGPFAHDQPHPEGSLLYLYLNTAKRSITLHVGCRAGMRLFEVLLQHADVVISDHPAPTPASVLPEHHVIYTCIRPFGLDGPHADWPLTELTMQALGGVMAIVGDPDRPPVQAGGRAGILCGGAERGCGDAPGAGGA